MVIQLHAQLCNITYHSNYLLLVFSRQNTTTCSLCFFTTPHGEQKLWINQELYYYGLSQQKIEPTRDLLLPALWGGLTAMRGRHTGTTLPYVWWVYSESFCIWHYLFLQDENLFVVKDTYPWISFMLALCLFFDISTKGTHAPRPQHASSMKLYTKK